MTSMTRFDQIMEENVGRAMLDSTAAPGEMRDYNAITRGVLRSILPGGRFGTKASTKDVLDAGKRAERGEMSEEEAKALEDSVRELNQANNAEGYTAQELDNIHADRAGEEGRMLLTPGEAPAGDETAPLGPNNLPDLTPEQIAARRGEELERRTWERNVNLDYVESPEQIGAVLEAGADLIPTAERESLATIAGDADANVDKLMSEVLTKPKDGYTLNSRQLLTGRRMLITITQEVDRLADKIVNQTATNEEVVKFNNLQNQALMLQRYMQGQIRESARALNSMRITANVLGGRRADQIAELVEAGGKAAHIQAKALQESRLVDDSPKGRLKQMEEVSRFNRTVRGVINYWVASILSGFKTQAVNVISNASWTTMDTFAIKPLAAAISPVRRKLTGDAEGVVLDESLAELVAFRQGMRDSLMMAGRVFNQGTFKNKGEYISSFEHDRLEMAEMDPQQLRELSGVDNIPYLGSVLGVPIDALQRTTEAFSYGALTAGDEFFKAMAYRKSIYGQAVRIAKSEGADIDRANELANNPTAEMHQRALQESERLTFTNESGGIAGMLGTTLRKLTQKYPLLKPVAPFIRTPTALLDRTIRLSPLALLSQEYLQEIAKGGANADVALAELTFGTAVMTWMYFLYQDGTLTGSGPKNYAQREALKGTGWQPNSIRIGDKYVSYDRGLDPLGMSVGALVDTLERAAYSKNEEEAAELMAGAALAIARYWKDSSYMQGISEALALSDGMKSPGPYAAKQLASFIPSWSRDFSKIASDPKITRVYPEQGFWSQLNTRMQQRLPFDIGADEPPLRDWTGTPVIAYQGGALYLYNTVSPIQVSQAYTEPASQELVDNGVSVSRPLPVITMHKYRNIKVDLINDFNNGLELYDKYLEFVGKARHKEVLRTIETKRYQNSTSGVESQRFDLLEDALRKGRKKGARDFSRWLSNQKFTEEQLGDKAVLMDRGAMQDMFNRYREGEASEEEIKLLQDAETKGVQTREPLPTPEPGPQRPLEAYPEI